MTTSYVSYNSYYGHECRWNDSVYDTYVTIAPSIYRWDAYDVYASASYSETLTEPSGATGSWSFSKAASTSGGYSFVDSFSMRTYQRKATAYTVTLTLSFTAGSSWSGSYHYVSSSATFTLTIPALTGYTVAYNADGGSGAPASQTKYQGQALTLSSAIPTRTGYNFKGWATSQGGAVAYQPGASYTADAAVTLWAVWEQAIVPPTVTLTAFRTASSSSTTESGDGAYVRANAVWAKGDNNVTNVQYRYSTNGGSFSSWANMSGTRTGTSGTAYINIALPTASYMTVEVKATDGTVTTTVSATIPSVNFPIKFHDQSQTDIFDLHLSNATSRIGETSGADLAITKDYTGGGFTCEQAVFHATADVVVVPIQFSSTSAMAWNNEQAAHIPSAYAPKEEMRFVVFTTSDWSTFNVGYGAIGTDGTIRLMCKSCKAIFGQAVWVRN